MISNNLPQFFTATILDWKMLLKPNEYKEIIINSLKYLVNVQKINVNAFVLMDNHIHLIWQLEGNLKQEEIQGSFLKFTAEAFKKDLKINNSEFLQKFFVNKADRKYQFWQRNSLSIELYSKAVFEQKLQYIHNNPVNAGLCKLPEEYYYSSAKFYETGNDNFGFLTHWDD
jgi:REP element-mobilizing transposase RayT